MLNRFGLTLICVAALLVAGAAFAGTASANLNDSVACQQVDDEAFKYQASSEEPYLSNPRRGTPHAQASIIMTSWGVNTADPFPRFVDTYAKGPYSAVCVINYFKTGGFNVQWHVQTEVRVIGDDQYITSWWNTARNCYGITNNGNGSLIAPPSGCGAYGAIDGNTAID
jgi:hypothetical protein